MKAAQGAPAAAAVMFATDQLWNRGINHAFLSQTVGFRV